MALHNNFAIQTNKYFFYLPSATARLGDRAPSMWGKKLFGKVASNMIPLSLWGVLGVVYPDTMFSAFSAVSG